MKFIGTIRGLCSLVTHKYLRYMWLLKWTQFKEISKKVCHYLPTFAHKYHDLLDTVGSQQGGFGYHAEKQLGSYLRTLSLTN